MATPQFGYWQCQGVRYSIFETHTLWTDNDVKEKVFTAFMGAFYLERPLKSHFAAFEGSFQVKCPMTHRGCKDPSGSFQLVIFCDIMVGS